RCYGFDGDCRGRPDMRLNGRCDSAGLLDRGRVEVFLMIGALGRGDRDSARVSRYNIGYPSWRASLCLAVFATPLESCPTLRLKSASAMNLILCSRKSLAL